MWASDAPVGEFNQKAEIYRNNLEEFKRVIQESFNDKTLLDNLLYNNAVNLYL